MNWLKDHFKGIILYGFLYGILMLFFLYPMPYELYLPGGVNSAEEFVEIEQSYPSSGSFNSSYVSVVTKPSPFQFLLAKLNNKAEIREMGKVERKIPIAEITKQDRLQKLNSINTSLIAAYDTANKEIHYTENGQVIIYRLMDSPAYKILEVGDIIVKINNTEITNYDKLSNELKSIECNESFYITVLRDEKEITLNIQKEKDKNDNCILGVYTYSNYIFDSTHSYPNFNIIDTTGYGPSAGLIQTLSVYNMLTPVDITYGLKIAGTGTIDVQGNVGIIGGINQKVFGACKANVDIFFAPDIDYLGGNDKAVHNNYKDALKAKEIMNSDIIIVPVKTLDDAINYLTEHYGQNN
ncbi:PDZ domain-containing protein [Mycoplasmatota bacterium]|nr:PDZ domain-containing protein [Mycoplasmatota bacterium]